jgi:hypothetical protein
VKSAPSSRGWAYQTRTIPSWLAVTTSRLSGLNAASWTEYGLIRIDRRVPARFQVIVPLVLITTTLSGSRGSAETESVHRGDTLRQHPGVPASDHRYRPLLLATAS